MTKSCGPQVAAWLGAALVQAGMEEGLLAQAADALAEAARQADPGTAAHQYTSGGSEQVPSMSTNVPVAKDTHQYSLPLPATHTDALLQAMNLLSLAAIEWLLPSLLATSGKTGSACSAQHLKHLFTLQLHSARLSWTLAGPSEAQRAALQLLTEPACACLASCSECQRSTAAHTLLPSLAGCAEHVGGSIEEDFGLKVWQVCRCGWEQHLMLGVVLQPSGSCQMVGSCLCHPALGDPLPVLLQRPGHEARARSSRCTGSPCEVPGGSAAPSIARWWGPCRHSIAC